MGLIVILTTRKKPELKIREAQSLPDDFLYSMIFAHTDQQLAKSGRDKINLEAMECNLQVGNFANNIQPRAVSTG